ncbi:hypothetical protein ATG_06570 [Desulfurococcaceae archaeon AG1]|nr:hypothetical protein ATG_06570 [Desulfurococcaceae archaeon AG1]
MQYKPWVMGCGDTLNQRSRDQGLRMAIYIDAMIWDLFNCGITRGFDRYVWFD